MGAVKNLFVRIGGDASGAVKGFNTASSAAGNAKERIKKASADTKRSIRDGFGSPIPSIKEYVATVARTKETHQAAAQNVTRLTDRIAQLEDVYGNVKNATDGLDLSKSLADQISTTEKTLDDINAKIIKTQDAIARIGHPTSASKAERLAKLQDELQALIAESDETSSHLHALDTAAARVGSANMGYASVAGLKALQAEINSVKNQLRATEMVVEETGQKLRSMRLGPTLARGLKSLGTSAWQAAKTGVSKLGSSLKGLAGSAVRGIASIPSKLKNIGKSASSGCNGLQKMARSIRNIGLVSLGLRVAGGMFGRLRSIISEYISQNETLNASVTSMKNQLGDALAPAINLVLVAMQRLMPVITSVSNAINSILTALFGKVSATSKAITSTAAAARSAADSLDVYGFDQITKVSDNSSSGGGGGSNGVVEQKTSEQSALVQKLTSWIQQLKAAFVSGDWAGLGSIIGNGINNAVNEINAVDIGAKIGTFANNFFTVLHSALSTINFTRIGSSVGEMLSSALGKIDAFKVGQTLGKMCLALPSVVVGFVQDTDWAQVGTSISESLRGCLQTVTDWLQSVDWLKLGDNLATLITNVDWSGIATDLFTCFGSSLGACVGVLWGFVDNAVKSIGDYFSEKIEECGGSVVDGLCKGIVDGLVNIGQWIADHIFKPFMEGFDGAFEIHSPSKVFEGRGGLLMTGLIKGIKAIDIWGSLSTWFSDKLLKPFTNGFVSVKNAAVDAFKGLWNGAKGWINKLIGGVESMVNGIIRGINGLIGSFNKISAVGDYFGVDLTISKIGTVSLPRLARGAVVDQPTAAVIGEAGKEAVMPLENNTGWITQLAKQINQQGGSASTSLALAIYFRSRKLAEYVIQDINQITKESGVCPIYL